MDSNGAYLPLDGLDLTDVQHYYKPHTCPRVYGNYWIVSRRSGLAKEIQLMVN